MWLKLIRNPILFQGRGKRRAYFEGWYYKQVSSDLGTAICFIPGISYEQRDPHSFIQVLVTRVSGIPPQTNMKFENFRFPLEAFAWQDEPFAIRIGENHFSATGIMVKLPGEVLTVQGEMSFGALHSIKTSLLHPNIMGVFGYIPRMECYHGVISMNHHLAGSLALDGEDISFTGGKGYIEKDWGSSFPSSYCWIQSNHFDDAGASLMCSIGEIPFMGSHFTGFIINFCLDDQEYRFASYNKSSLELHEFTSEKARLTVKRKDLILTINAQAKTVTTIHAPYLGAMSAAIKEGLSGSVAVTLKKSSGEILFKQTGQPCGIELMPNCR